MQASLPLVALVGCPNVGKTALFNRLTGSRQKVANYAGVTVERKEGMAATHAGTPFRVLDLPGAYSLRARSPDEAVTRDILLGRQRDAGTPDLLICVADATNLELHLRFVLELKQLGIPTILALNMFDLAERRGFAIDCAQLSRVLGMPVVPSVAVRSGKMQPLLNAVEEYLASPPRMQRDLDWQEPDSTQLRNLNRTALRLLDEAGIRYGTPPVTTYAIDRLLLHPVAGLLVLVGVMFLMFQAVFSWSAWPMDLIDQGAVALGQWVGGMLPEGLLHSFIVDGMIAGVGSVIIFLPQIIVLYFFILLLEDSGYMARAAFLLDRLMGGVGLHGKAFIPLLSSFACAIPGIMATRTIEHRHDRLTTILIAPLMTCSARLPVYTLLIAAFIPARSVFGGFNLQGVVMFALYMAGLVFGLLIAFILKRFVFREQVDSFVMELPTYKLPSLRNLALGLFERVKIFLKRAGTTIFVVMVAIWVLSTFPQAPVGAENPIHYSYAGQLGKFLAPLFAPIGFSWQMVIALIPGMAAREVAVAVLGTVYAVGGQSEAGLAATLAASWSLPAALSFLVWYIFAPQCISTLAVIRREANSTKIMWVAFGYLMALAYTASFITYRVASSW
jgi:ferrous iron transport protein B